MKEAKTYLLAFFASDLQREHARLLEAVKYHSDGDFVEVAKHAGSAKPKEPVTFSAVYLFTTTKPPSEIGIPLLRGDRYLLIQVQSGLHHAHHNLSVAHAWLDRHTPRHR